MTYQKSQTVSELLTWSHFVELLKIDDPRQGGSPGYRTDEFLSELLSRGDEHGGRHGTDRNRPRCLSGQTGHAVRFAEYHEPAFCQPLPAVPAGSGAAGS